MIAAVSTSSADSSKRRHSELPFAHLHRPDRASLPHQDAAITHAAQEGARMGVGGPLSHQGLPPEKESTKAVSSSGVQIFLCLMGTLMSACVSLWMAMFSKDTLARRTLISLVAAVCALIFSLIAYAAFKRRHRKPAPDDIEISSAIIREHRKSMTSSLRKSTANGEELMRQIRRHSSVIAVDAARQQLLKEQYKDASKHHNLLAVGGESPQKKRASTSN